MDYSSIEHAEGVEDTTKMHNITKALVTQGFTQKEIKKSTWGELFTSDCRSVRLTQSEEF